MKKLIAIIFCTVCLFAVDVARAQTKRGAIYGAPQLASPAAVASSGALPAPGASPGAGTTGVPAASAVPISVCMNRNPPEGTVITKSVRDPACNGQCRSEIEIPTRDRMVICRGQSIPKGYEIELLTSTPDCSCAGGDQNAYTIKAETKSGSEN